MVHFISLESLRLADYTLYELEYLVIDTKVMLYAHNMVLRRVQNSATACSNYDVG